MVKRRNGFHLSGMLLAVLAIGLMAGAALATDAGWLTSVQAAQVQARKSNKVILANFTGSDWCVWCKRLKQEVFVTPAFAKWAAQNAVLLEVDFPDKIVQQPPLKAQNKALAEKYGVTGYPAVLFLDPDGKEIGRTGYFKGGAEKWIANADLILADRPKPPELKTAASLAAGQTDAASSGKLLLLILSDTRKAGEAAKGAETLANDAEFVTLANGRAVTVRLKESPAKDSEEGKALAALVLEYKLPAGPTLLALLDLGEKKVLYQSAMMPKPSAAVTAIKKVLPPLKYDGAWLEDFAQAKAIAAELKRPLLLDFTGSDWCGWCIKLDKEIFSTDTFKKYAAANLVLVKIDFPRKKELPPQVKSQNEALSLRFGVEGYPTIIVLASDGAKRLGEMSYDPNGPDLFVDRLKKLISGGGKTGSIPLP